MRMDMEKYLFQVRNEGSGVMGWWFEGEEE